MAVAWTGRVLLKIAPGEAPVSVKIVMDWKDLPAGLAETNISLYVIIRWQNELSE